MEVWGGNAASTCYLPRTSPVPRLMCDTSFTFREMAKGLLAAEAAGSCLQRLQLDHNPLGQSAVIELLKVSAWGTYDQAPLVARALRFLPRAAAGPAGPPFTPPFTPDEGEHMRSSDLAPLVARVFRFLPRVSTGWVPFTPPFTPITN